MTRHFGLLSPRQGGYSKTKSTSSLKTMKLLKFVHKSDNSVLFLIIIFRRSAGRFLFVFVYSGRICNNFIKNKTSFDVLAVTTLSVTCACTWPLSSSCLVSTKCICPCAVGIDVVTTTPSWLPLFLSDTVQTFAPLLPWVTFSLFSSKLSINRKPGGKKSTINSVPINTV